MNAMNSGSGHSTPPSMTLHASANGKLRPVGSTPVPDPLLSQPLSIPNPAPAVDYAQTAVAPSPESHPAPTAERRYKAATVQPPEQFVYQSKQTAVAPKALKKKKEYKPFNAFKWALITPIALAAMTPFVGTGAAAIWFMSKPKQMAKKLNPTDIRALIKSIEDGDKNVKIPEGMHVPNPYKDDNGQTNVAQKGVKALLGKISALRHLPQENKWDMLKYFLSPTGLKEFADVPRHYFFSAFQDHKTASKYSLNFVASIMKKGGPVATKYVQSMANEARSTMLSAHRVVLKYMEQDAEKIDAKELQKLRDMFFVKRDVFKSFSKLQSSSEPLKGWKAAHQLKMYNETARQFNSTNPEFAMPIIKDINELKNIEASTSIVSLTPDGRYAVKALMPGASPEKAADQLQVMVELVGNDPRKNIILDALGIEDSSAETKDIDILKKAMDSILPFLDGSDLKNEVEGLSSILKTQRKLGGQVGLSPAPKFITKINGFDTVVMEQLHGDGDMVSILSKAVMSDTPFDLEARSWDQFRSFAENEAYSTVAMMYEDTISMDLHHGNIMPKTAEEFAEMSAKRATNTGAKVLDVAEYIQLPPELLKAKARITLKALEYSSLQPPKYKGDDYSSQEYQDYLEKVTEFNDKSHEVLGDLTSELKKLYENNGRGIEESKFDTLALKIARVPIRSVEYMLEDKEMAKVFKIKGGKNVNHSNLQRAVDKMQDLATDQITYERLMYKDKAVKKKLQENKETAVKMIFNQYLDYAGDMKFSKAQQKAMRKDFEKKLLLTKDSNEFNPDSHLSNAAFYSKEIDSSLDKAVTLGGSPVSVTDKLKEIISKYTS